MILVLSLTTLSSLTNAAATTERLSGKDRFEVAVNVSKKGWSTSGTVVIAYYNAFADALTAGPLAYKNNAPILLTHSDHLTPATKTEIQRLAASKVIIVGGPGSISDNVINEIHSMGISDVTRIGGKDRFEVSFNIANQLNPTDTAVLAFGLNFPDALAISPYASKNGYPILLTQKDTLPVKTSEALSAKNIQKTIVIGGEGSVSQAVFNQLPGKQRIGGKDRYEVAANIINQLNLPTSKAYIATGLTFADALTGSVLAAKEDAPLLLTHPTSAPAPIKNVIQTRQIQNFTILGGPASVPDKVVSDLVNPLPLTGKRIVLDPGHGGSDPGAVNGSTYEKTINNQFTLKLGNKLQALGATVIYTRSPNSDVYISLEDRANFANQQNADFFLSIHHDSSTDKSVRGLSSHYSTYRPAIETSGVVVMLGGKEYPFVSEDTENKLFYYIDGNTTKSVNYNYTVAYDRTPSPAAVKSAQMAPGLGQSITSHGIPNGTPNAKDHNLYVTRWTNMPSVLIELGFMSNNTELAILLDQSIQDQRAQSLANTIKDYLLQ